jgi:hypothetical protein
MVSSKNDYTKHFHPAEQINSFQRKRMLKCSKNYYKDSFSDGFNYYEIEVERDWHVNAICWWLPQGHQYH